MMIQINKNNNKTMYNTNNNSAGGMVVIAILIFLGIGFIISLFWMIPTYKIWSREQNGKAQLKEAEWTKKISIEVSKAKAESATLEAQAEIERAKGVAKANEIIADSLKQNEAYLRYLWIDKLSDNQNVIYVPTEAGLPILEAGNRK